MTAFLSRLEALSPTLPRLTSLRAHPSYLSLLKRFQLPVYYQLRLKDAVAAVERAFELGSASGGGGDGWVMSESEAVWRAVGRCWEDDVWLEELAGRFWRLTLQVRGAFPSPSVATRELTGHAVHRSSAGTARGSTTTSRATSSRRARPMPTSRPSTAATAAGLVSSPSSPSSSLEPRSLTPTRTTAHPFRRHSPSRHPLRGDAHTRRRRRRPLGGDDAAAADGPRCRRPDDGAARRRAV